MRVWIACIALFLSLMSIQGALANIAVSPNPVGVTVKAGEQKTFNITLTNNYNFSVMDIEFSNMSGFTIPEIDLEAGETKNVDISVQREISGIYNIPSVLSFKYVVELPDEEQTHIIEITELGYEPSFLVIRQGDRVRWENKDDITHTVTSATFDHDIAPNQSREIQFDNVGEVNYQDLILFYTGTIDVVDPTTAERINNPDYNQIINFNLEVTLDPTSLEITNSDEEYEIDALGSQEGLLEIKNIGNITSQRVELTSEPNWIIFDENLFDIEIGEKNFVTYHVEPLIFETAETNMTHNVTIKVKGSNTEEYEVKLSVYVPHKDTFDDVNTNEGFLSFFQRFCEQNQQLIICNNTIQEGGGETTVRDVEIPVNLTEREVYAMLKRIQRIEDSNERANNEVKELSSSLDVIVPELMKLINQSVMMQRENEDVSTARTRGFWVAALFIIIVSSIVVAGFAFRRYSYKKSLMEGGLTYR